MTSASCGPATVGVHRSDRFAVKLADLVDVHTVLRLHSRPLVDVAGRNVLVVDDDAEVVETLDELLRAHGYEVTTSRDGAEALDVFRQRAAPFALVVLDWLLPKVSGAQVMSYLVEDPQHRGTQVVVLSGHDRILPTLGVAAVIAKPVHARTLLLVVDRLAGAPPTPFLRDDSVPVHVPIERRARHRSQTISLRRPR